MLYDKRWDKPQADAIGELILAAADRLDRDGWCRGTYHDEQGRHCIIGAFLPSKSIVDITSPNIFHAVDRISTHLGMCPQHWNDIVCQSGEQASAMLRQVALEK
jgi:hypothetical protein